jgi:outer membrane protein TolC
MKRANWIVVVGLVVLSGCTPEAYRKSADLQVEKLLKDRETQTLGYVPQVQAEVATDPTPSRRAYDKLPLSPIPPASPPPLEPMAYELQYEPLGPKQLFAAGQTAPQRESMSVDEARRPTMDRLRLGPPTRISTTTVLDLFQSIHYAVQHSRDYQTRMEDLYLAALDVTLQRHLFEPRPFANTSLNYTGGQADVNYRSAYNITNSAGIRQQLPYGGEIVAQGLVTFINALNDNVADGETAQLALNGTVPLLRGAGMVNLEPLIASERSLVYQVRTFEDYRRSFVVNVASQYFRLLNQASQIANRRVSYINSYRTWELSNEMYGAGRPGFNFLSVQRAKSALFQAENNLIRAIDSYQSSLDDFKILIGMPVEEDLDVVQLQLEITPPNTDSDDAVVALALKYRLDLQTASDRVEDARRAVSNSKNNLLPDVDLTGRASLGNETGNSAVGINSDTMDYSAGVSIDWPLDRVAERNSYRRSLISLERAQRSLRETHDQVISSVRDAVRAIRSAQATLEIQQRDIANNRERLEYANEQLVLGRATNTQDAVDAQNNLLTAQDQYDTARANYQIQILSFLRDTGTLRVNPEAGELGIVMDRTRADIYSLPTTQPQVTQ